MSYQPYLSADVKQTPFQKRVTISVEKQPLSSALKLLEEKAGLKINFNYEDVDRYTIDLRVKDQPVENVLQQMLEGKPLSYTYQKDDNIVIIIKQQLTGKVKAATGIITDEYNIPLSGAGVSIKGTTIGTLADSDGKFRLDIPQDEKSYALVFSYLGMSPVEMNPAENMHVKLEERSHLKEVIVTGVFNKPRESYTGAVTSISSKELKMAGNRSVLSQIQNIDPSFNILENNLAGSNPNRLPDIQMRGVTSLGTDVKNLQSDFGFETNPNLPLFIIDGFETNLQKVIDMDNSLIESIHLLKDASATAMYGSRGANGIVVITTKKPEAGKLRVTYKADLNIEIADLNSYNLLNAKDKLAYELSAGVYSYASGPAQSEQSLIEIYNSKLLDAERGVDTYWLKYPVRTGVGQKHSLRIDGGAEGFRYAANISYNNTEGVMKGSSRETISGDMYFQYDYKKFRFQNTLMIMNNSSNNSSYGSFSQYTLLNPYWMPYDENGKINRILENNYYENFYKTIKVYNPLYDASLPYRNSSEYTNIQNNFSIDWTILPELTFRGSLKIEKQSGRSDLFLSPDHSSFAEYYNEDFARKGSYTYGTSSKFGFETYFTLNYSKLFQEKHQISVGLNYSVSETKTEATQIKGEGYSGSSINELGMGTFYKKNGKPSSSESILRRLGGILNVNYTYDQRYFVDVSGKLDASSQFGNKNRTAPFWSSGIGWNAHYESFLKDNDFVSLLRLKLSYGTSGSQNYNPYQALTTFKYYENESYDYFKGTYMLALGNPDLKWQESKQFNVGFETLVWNERLRLSGDYYNKRTDNLLSDINIPLSGGFNSYKANIGEIKVNGIELGATVFVLRDRNKNIDWSLGGTLRKEKDQIVKISNSLKFLNDQMMQESRVNPSFLYEEGQSLNTIFAVQSLGIDPSNGREIFVKRDGSLTYTWDPSDQVASGVNNPKFRGTFNTAFRYKGLTFNTYFSYRLGGYIYNYTLASKVENVDPWYNVDERVYTERWKQPGDHAAFKSVTDRSVTYATTRFIMKENTLRCSSVNLSYELNPDLVRRILPLSYLSLGFYMEDLFQISSIKQERGTDYPFSRKFSFSLTARF